MIPSVNVAQVRLVDSLDAAITSVLEHWQWFKGHYLFDNIAILNPRTNLPFVATATRAYEDRSTGENALAFYRDLAAAMESNTAQGILHAENPEAAVLAKRVARFQAVHDVVLRYLENSIDDRLRYAAIVREQAAAGSVFDNLQAPPPQVDAFLFGQGYRQGGVLPERAIERFFASRGVVVQCRRNRFAPSAAYEYPTVLVSPSGRACVLVGQIEMAGECWAALIDPDTVAPIRSRQEERISRLREARAIRAPASSTTTASRPHSSSSKETERRRALGDIIVTDCPVTGLPTATSSGLHLVTVRLLSDWDALTISQP